MEIGVAICFCFFMGSKDVATTAMVLLHCTVLGQRECSALRKEGFACRWDVFPPQQVAQASLALVVQWLRWTYCGLSLLVRVGNYIFHNLIEVFPSPSHLSFVIQPHVVGPAT